MVSVTKQLAPENGQCVINLRSIGSTFWALKMYLMATVLVVYV